MRCLTVLSNFDSPVDFIKAIFYPNYISRYKTVYLTEDRILTYFTLQARRQQGWYFKQSWKKNLNRPDKQLLWATMVMKDREMPLNGAPLYFATSSAATLSGVEKYEPNNWDLIRPLCHYKLLQEIIFFRTKTGFKIYRMFGLYN